MEVRRPLDKSLNQSTAWTRKWTNGSDATCSTMNPMVGGTPCSCDETRRLNIRVASLDTSSSCLPKNKKIAELSHGAV